MPARRESRDHDAIGVDAPLVGVVDDRLHRRLGVGKRTRPGRPFTQGVSQDESLVAGPQEGQCDRLGFPVGTVFVSPARQHQDGRTPGHVAELVCLAVRIVGEGDCLVAGRIDDTIDHGCEPRPTPTN